MPEQDEALKERLLRPSGVDLETPAQGGAPQRKRSWTSLLGTALVYVWPTNRLLQVRLCRPHRAGHHRAAALVWMAPWHPGSCEHAR